LTSFFSPRHRPEEIQGRNERRRTFTPRPTIKYKRRRTNIASNAAAAAAAAAAAKSEQTRASRQALLSRQDRQTSTTPRDERKLRRAHHRIA
jgi:hypothetical protein